MRKSYLDWLIRKIEPGIDSTIGFSDGQLRARLRPHEPPAAAVLVVGGDATYRENDAALPNGLLGREIGQRAGVDRVALRARSRDHDRCAARFSAATSTTTARSTSSSRAGYTQTIVARMDVAVPLERGWSLDRACRGEWSEMNRILADFANAPRGTVRLRSKRDESARWTVATAWVDAGKRTAAGGITLGARVSRRSGGADLAAAPWVLVERRIGASWTVARRRRHGGAVPRSDAARRSSTPSIPNARAIWTSASSSGSGARSAGQVTAFDRREADVLRRIGEDRLDPDTGLRVSPATFPTFAPRSTAPRAASTSS